MRGIADGELPRGGTRDEFYAEMKAKGAAAREAKKAGTPAPPPPAPPAATLTTEPTTTWATGE